MLEQAFSLARVLTKAAPKRFQQQVNSLNSACALLTATRRISADDAQQLLQQYLAVEKQCLQQFNQNYAADRLLPDLYFAAIVAVLHIVSRCMHMCGKDEGSVTPDLNAAQRAMVTRLVAASGENLADLS